MLGQPDQRVVLDRGAGAARDVVEHHRQVDRVGGGLEVPHQGLLRRLVVVRRHQQQAVRAGLLGAAGQLDGVMGVVGARARDHPGPVPDRLDDGADQALLLVVAGRGRLTGRPADHQAVVAVVDQVGGDPLGRVEVEPAVGAERGDHRGEDAAERGRCCRRRCSAGHGRHATGRTGASGRRGDPSPPARGFGRQRGSPAHRRPGGRRYRMRRPDLDAARQVMSGHGTSLRPTGRR